MAMLTLNEMETPSFPPNLAPPPTNSLMLTKFHVPAVRNTLVSRERLLDKLSAARQSKLTLISAPAGFGKTTLLAQWIENSQFPIAWVSLDESDNDPVRFWRYLGNALELVEPGCGLRLEEVFQLPPAEQLVIGLINNFTTVQRDVFLVLDDYHLIDNPLIHSALTLLLDHLPPRLHLVVSSRVEPPFPLARLRVRGQLTEIRVTDLRFHLREAQAFFSSTMGLKLSEGDIQTLEDSTEGWVAALQLAALGLQNQPELTSFVSSFKGNHRYVVNYLMEEVLQHQTHQMQNFLMRTSILERLNAPLVEKLTDCQDGQIMLQNLEKLNMFLVPLDLESGWYRYHHMFRQYMHTRLKQKFPAEVSELHRTVAEWYIQNGDSGEAIPHLLTAGDLDHAADLIEQNYFAMMASSQLTTYLNWILALPANYRQTRPAVCVAAAWLYWFKNEFKTSQEYIDIVEDYVASQPGKFSVQTHGWLSETRGLRARLMLERKEIAQAKALCDETMAQTSQEDTLARGLLFLLKSQIHNALDQRQEAEAALKEGLNLARADNNMLLTLSTLAELVNLQSVNGQLTAIAETNRQAIQLATAPDGHPLPGAAVGHAGLGRVLAEWNETEKGLEHFKLAIELGMRGGLINPVFNAYLGMALIYQAQNQPLAAQESLEQAARLIQPSSAADLHERLKAYQARLMLKQNDLISAKNWAEQMAQQIPEELNLGNDFEYFTLVRVWLTLAERESYTCVLKRVETFLEKILETSRAKGQTGRIIETLILQTMLNRLLGYEKGAVECLYEALKLAQFEGYVSLFVNEGDPMYRLLLKLKGAAGLSEYVQKLLNCFPTEVLQPELPETKTTTSAPVPSTLMVLTPRELEVLREMATGANNQTIADRLVISLHTTKIHVARILAKLEVTSRTEAVAVANKLNLI